MYGSGENDTSTGRMYSMFPINELCAYLQVVSVQAAELCERVPLLTNHHHNMLYIVSLMPLVDRGSYLRCLLSYTFLSALIPTPPDIGNFLEVKVGTVY